LAPLFFEIIQDLEKLGADVAESVRGLQEKRDLGWSIEIDELLDVQSKMKQYEADYDVYSCLYKALSTLHGMAPLVIASTGKKLACEAAGYRETLVKIIADLRREQGLEEDYSTINMSSPNFSPASYRDSYLYYRYLHSESAPHSPEHELLKSHFKDVMKSDPIRFESSTLALPLLGMFYKSYTLNFQLQYYQPETPTYTFDLAELYLNEDYKDKTVKAQDSIVLNMRGLVKLRNAVFSAFREAINVQLRTLAISNFEHPSFKPHLPQLCHIIREASVMFTGNRIEAIYILNSELFQLLDASPGSRESTSQ
jgi:hypothetical protein